MRYLVALIPQDLGLLFDPWSEAAMTLGSRSGRVGSVFAALVIVAMAGCHAMPVDRLTASPNRPRSTSALASVGRAALLPATVAMDPPSEMSSIEPVASSTTRTNTTVVTTAPTPLLDAALLKAQGREESPTADPLSKPETPAPMLEPSTAPATLPSAEPTAPRPLELTNDPSPPPPTPRPSVEPEPAHPEDLWRDGVRRLGGVARQMAGMTTVPGSPWSLRARVLAWLAEPDLDPDLGQREADGVRAVLRALDETSVESPRRGVEVRSAVLVLEDKAPFEITDLRVCCKVDGFGDFQAFEPPAQKAGQPVILYGEFDGLRFEQTSSGFRTRIAAQLEILPAGGGPPILSRPLNTAEETCRRRRRDYYVPYVVVPPRSLEPGNYRLRLTAKDLNSDRSATREVPFAIAKE